MKTWILLSYNNPTPPNPYLHRPNLIFQLVGIDNPQTTITTTNNNNNNNNNEEKEEEESRCKETTA